MAVTYNHSNRFQEVFTKMGKPEAYQVPLRQLQGHDHLTSRESALAFLNDETWEHQPWGKGSGTMKQVIRHDEILRQNGEPDDGMAEFVHNWLDEHQDPATGYWFGERASPNNRACGAYKLICWLYRSRQWKINYLDKIVDTTLALQSPRGDFGVYLVSDGGDKPYRLKIRTPSFANLQALRHLLRDAYVADAVVILGSVDIVLGEVDR